MKFKVNDKVLVISGKDKGKSGTILRFSKDYKRAAVTGVNVCKKHVKASQGRPGGIIPQEATIAISNLSMLCPNCDKKTRVGYQRAKDGRKERLCKKCKQAIFFPSASKEKSKK